ncbi:MAG: hypothetical protein PHZ04_04935 [Patescibacteria group bacterium]|nr:hypothetical protein [Patescibacteria group bacterium]MDD5294440.1 hypothetical protein [Patescibacteria group bacterium]MDD5554114.1 hypothetical protein [Patescibacteria group bacterium]
MNEQNFPQSNRPTQSSKNIWIMAIFVVATAIIVGSGVYAWQRLNLKSTEQSLLKQIVELQKENADLKVTVEPTPTKLLDTAKDIKLPVVFYTNPWILDKTEKKNFEKKLVNPYIDYYNEKEINLITLTIKAPDNVGEPYEISAIFKDGSSEFLFGEREKDYNYWFPDCMGTCNLSEEFKKKYPEIAEFIN